MGRTGSNGRSIVVFGILISELVIVMLFLRRNQEEFMHNHVESCLPEEGCGLIGGKDGHAEMILAVTNTEHSPTRFYMDEQELYSAHLAFEKAGLEMVAIYHSHPAGPQMPSETDLKSFTYYPGILSVILVKKSNGWQTNAFEINGASCKKVRIAIG